MVGKKIRAYREFRGYSQIQLAELSGINVGTIRIKKYYCVILRTKCGKAASPNSGAYSKPS